MEVGNKNFGTIHAKKSKENTRSIKIYCKKGENFVRCRYFNNFRHGTVLDHVFRHNYINKFCNQFFSAIVFFP
jgi:hypothetical protein